VPRAAAVSAPDLDADALLGRLAPFTVLSPELRARAAGSVRPERFGAGDPVIERFSAPRFLFVVAEGAIEERDGAGVIGRYGPGEAFDFKAVTEGRSETSFVAVQPSLCLGLPAGVLAEMIRTAPAFRDGVHAAVAEKVDALIASQQRREAGAFLLNRIGEGALHPPVFVPLEMPVAEVVALMSERNTSFVLVRRDGDLGIFTSRDVREKLVLMQLPGSAAVGDMATFALVTLHPDDFLFNALELMTRHAIRHVVVRDGDQVAGVLEQADLLQWLANSSYAVAQRIERAETTANLIEAGRDLPQMVRALHDRGVKPRYIARMVTELSRKILARLFNETLAPALGGGACLLVLGSEGRAEQILRTDQDNAIILAQPQPWAEIEAALRRFTETLASLGYPPCPGGVMVSNPLWTRDLPDFKRQIRQWITGNEMAGLLNLAILYDAAAVAGDGERLAELKAHLFALMREGNAHLGYFARAILGFETPMGLFGRFRTERNGPHKGLLDIKKGGVFPIVHGVRSLALEHGLAETNTIARIQLLKERAVLADRLAADLIESFDFLSMARLRAQLLALETGRTIDNHIDPASLNRVDRDLLRLAFQTVDELKKVLQVRFRLHMVS
jgi:CBS domain-containing protein